jgi:hypothetical protein
MPNFINMWRSEYFLPNLWRVLTMCGNIHKPTQHSVCEPERSEHKHPPAGGAVEAGGEYTGEDGECSNGMAFIYRFGARRTWNTSSSSTGVMSPAGVYSAR